MATTQPSIGGSLNVTVELHGWSELQRKLKGALEERGFIAEPWREAMGDAAKLLESYALRGAPLNTGRTAALMYSKVDRKPMPRWFKVATRARRGRFPYPRFTNYSPFASRIRPGNRRARPNPNRFWFDKTLISAWTHMPRILDSAARKMEQLWRS